MSAGRTTLSVGLVTAAPAERVAVALHAVRALADEIVLLIDERLPPPHRRALERLADRSATVAFVHVDAHLEALHALCTGEWVLRLDGGELASAALLRRLPALLADERRAQWAIRRCWLFPDPDHWIDEVPWAPDYQPRLLRRTAQRFSGTLHAGTDAVEPVGYVDEPFYNLDCLVEDQAERQAQALVSEVLRPEVLSAGPRPMHRRYEPERFATLPPADVPPEDRPTISRWLAAS